MSDTDISAPLPATEAEKLFREAEVMVEIAKALQGLTDEQASRVVRAAAILYGVDLVPR